MASSRSVYTAAAKPPAPRRRPKQRAVVVKVGLPGPEGFAEAFQQAAGAGAVVLPLARVPTLLQALGLAPGAAQLAAALQSLGSSGRTALGRDDAAVLCQMLAFGSGCSSSQASSPMRSLAGSPLQAAAAAASEAGSSGDGGGARACLRSLSRQRSTSGYEATGRLCTDDAVVGFVVALDEHRKKCELTGRYAEAAAAAARIAALKTAQAERLRSELVELQQGELERLQGRYFVETADFDQEWRGRVASYEADVAGQVAGLKAAQEQQLLQLLVRCEARRPGKPQHSAEYLNHRKIEDVLVKQGQYRKAHAVKTEADELYLQELSATQTNHEAGVALKRMKLQARQQVELEVLLQRASRGRNELELRRLDEANQRHNRFRCMVQELDSMHRQEVAHLENWLEGQAAAGKYSPLRDSTFKRRRDLLGL